MLNSESETGSVLGLKSSSSLKPHIPAILKGGGLTAANLMELQEAAFQLRSKCTQMESENKLLVEKLSDCRSEILHLRTSELLLQKEVSIWSSFSRLFAQPLYETRIALGRYQIEAQQLMIQELIRDRERKDAFKAVESQKQRRENIALMTKLRQINEERDKEKENNAEDKVQLRKIMEDSKAVRKQMSILQNDLTFCMNRLEESERERSRLQRHLSEHQVALTKRRRDDVDIKWYEEEIRSRDDLIAELQRTVREVNLLLAEQTLVRLEKRGEEGISPSRRQFLSKEPVISPVIAGNVDGCSSEKLHQSIQRLRKQLEREVDSPTHRRRRLFSHHSTPTRSFTSPFSSSWTEGDRVDSMSVGLQEFLVRELQAPIQ
ncbi:uncharacterized protein TM35_000044830 [Trypanosoma theileri]|uniref:Uncharacterized protein n=1 Tax=Trypanosoma theileri TaxID=67003 RepID=A0A1X0P6Q9_9TRYP|nr:uncharacterized protein TM35_000044830 [Trypanosoma theileri]ORC92269.1 hypothetical protein TM35_000044830 [Trypanosoma theileri]